MGIIMSRMDYKQNYAKYHQGLFVVLNPKRLPKAQPEINVGKAVSTALCDIPKEQRKLRVSEALENALQHYGIVTLTHIEVLFTDYFELDVIRSILNLCRNRKICCLWPGQWREGKLLYATPEFSEYYECDIKTLNEIYIIAD